MNITKTAATTAAIGALGLGAYAIASPLLLPVGAAMVLGGGLSWLYQQAHKPSEQN